MTSSEKKKGYFDSDPYDKYGANDNYIDQGTNFSKKMNVRKNQPDYG